MVLPVPCSWRKQHQKHFRFRRFCLLFCLDLLSYFLYLYHTHSLTHSLTHSFHFHIRLVLSCLVLSCPILSNLLFCHLFQHSSSRLGSNHAMSAAQLVNEKPPASRTRVALTVLFHSTCAIWSTILSKSALNGVEAPVTLLALQTTVQVLLLTSIGVFAGWVKLSRPTSVSQIS